MSEGIESTINQEVKRLLGSTKSDFIEDTIIGSDINQIRHLFYYLKSERIPVFISYLLNEYRTHVDTLDDTTVTFKIPDFEEGSVRRCRLKFEALGTLYQFEVALQNVSRDGVIIKMPDFIQTIQPRKFKRVRMDDVFMKFTINYRPFFISSADVQSVTTRYPAIIEELKKDEPNIYLINHIITEEISSISQEFEMKFYSPDEKTGEIEKIIGNEHKTFFITDTSKIENYIELMSDHNLTNYYSLYKKMRRESSGDDAEKYFKNIQKENIRNFISNYVYAPLYIFNKNVGHIFLYSTVLDKQLIRGDQANQIHLLAGLLSYAMSKVVIAMSYYRHSLTRIVNISMGGLLFELNQKEIFDFLIFHDNIKLEIQLKQSVLNFKAEITRSFPCSNGHCIGVNFYGAEGDDFKTLENFLFRKASELHTAEVT